MSFPTLLKKKQNRMQSKIWRTTLTAREIEKNNFHVTGDVHKAHEFAFTAANYETPPIEPVVVPTLIFSKALCV